MVVAFLTQKNAGHTTRRTHNPMDLCAMTFARYSRGEKRAASAYSNIIARPLVCVNTGNEKNIDFLFVADEVTIYWEMVDTVSKMCGFTKKF